MVSERNIRSHGKTDSLTKVLAISQSGWLVIQASHVSQPGSPSRNWN